MKRILSIIGLCLIGVFCFGQNSFKLLIDWDNEVTSVIGLEAEEDAEGNFIILSNNQSFSGNTNGIPIEGDLTLGSGLTKVSANGEILWKKSYSTNQYPYIDNGDLNLLGRIPTTHFLVNTQQEIILPFSRYAGILPCTDLIGSFSYKKSVLSLEKEGTTIREKLFLQDEFCDSDIILDLIEIEEVYYLLYFESNRGQLLLEQLNKDLEVLTQTVIDTATTWAFLDPYDQNVIAVSSDTLTVYDFVGQVKFAMTLDLNFFPTHAQFTSNANYQAYLLSGNSTINQEPISALLALDKENYSYEKIIVPQADFCDLALTMDDQILVLADRSRGDLYDSMAQPLRIILFDTQFRSLAYKDHGLPYVHPTSLSLTSDGAYAIVGTRLKSVDVANGPEPNQLFFKKGSLEDLPVNNQQVPIALPIQLYPNPSTAHLFVDLSESDAINDYRIDILNINGEVLYTKDHCFGNQMLATASFASGYYYVQIKNQAADTVFIEAFVKE